MSRRKALPPDSTPRERSLDALAQMRHGSSRRVATRAARTDPRTLHRYVGSALRKSGGRWKPTPFDRIPRQMNVLTPTGPVLLVIRDSRAASKVAAQGRAIARYRDKADEQLLRELGRSSVTVGGHTYHLQLDTDTLDRLIEGAELHYDLYAR